ncbi:MAG: DUF4870 domain-containing protein [Caldimicrobium sp.]
MEQRNTKERKINPLAVLSYIGIFCLIPLIIEKEDEFVRFHARQGFVLFLCEVATVVISWFPIIGWLFGFFATILWIILSFVGIINVIQAKEAPLPLVGKFANRFKI